MLDFDFDNNPKQVDEWQSRIAAVNLDPESIFDLVGATRREIEGYVRGLEYAYSGGAAHD